MDVLKILAIIGNAAILIIVLELIRRGRLKERYSLLWLFASIVLLLLSSSRGLLDALSHAVGIFYSPSVLFLIGFVFLLMITLHFSVVISGLTDKNKKLAQELAILKQQLEQSSGVCRSR